MQQNDETTNPKFNARYKLETKINYKKEREGTNDKKRNNIYKTHP